MQNKFITLREKHPVFTYEKYEITDLGDRLAITYFFHLGDDILFTPKWEFSRKHTYIDYEHEEIVRKLAFHLGLVELISYWKCACPPLVIIKAGYIDEEQIDWWKQQYYLGLGEFFYTNGIETDQETFLQVVVDSGAEVREQADVRESDDEWVDIRTTFEKSGCLIPIGGGKDSIVTLELLSDRKSSNLCYMINKKEASERCAEVAGYTKEEVLIVNRTLDQRLLALNKEGYLNGHTPFSAIVAFSSVLSAYLYDKRYVVLSNESSANESTVEGTMVNHQYSKSFKFESDFTDYELRYINSGVHYFSLLRPFSELQIAKHFALQEKYHEIFRSCNVGSKVDQWCGHCPKCLFVYIILSPFITIQRLIEIFGSDMLNDESMIPTFDKLIGLAPEKPFECVGTCDEANTAVCMTIRRLTADQEELPKLYQYYKDKGLYIVNDKNKNPYIKYYNEENQIPEEFTERLKALMLSE
jgi:UDP-N-acetyl-alpha-D-muramoyl-L-alanyl-L-glutamate epimerase